MKQHTLAEVLDFTPKNETDISINIPAFDSNSPKYFYFNQSHLQTHLTLINRAAYPKYYGSKTLPEVKYLDTIIVNIDDVDDNNAYFDQPARVSINPEYASIRDDIMINGFSLAELPIMVMKTPDGKWVILEGRTRYHILRSLGVKSIIVDEFRYMSPTAALRFAVSANAQKKPFGAASFEDIKKAILTFVNYGAIDKTLNTEQFHLAVLDEINQITNKLNPTQVNQIVHYAKSIVDGQQSVRSFPNGAGTKEWLIENGYKDTREVMYLAVGTYTEKLHKIMLRNKAKTADDVEIRIVVHCGVPCSKNPEQDWMKCKNFAKTFQEYEEAISALRFGGAPIQDSRIKIYGCIPQIKSLEKKYPMNKLVRF